MLFIIFIILSYTRYARRYGLTDQTAKRRFFSAVSALTLTIAASYAGAFKKSQPERNNMKYHNIMP